MATSDFTIRMQLCIVWTSGPIPQLAMRSEGGGRIGVLRGLPDYSNQNTRTFLHLPVPRLQVPDTAHVRVCLRTARWFDGDQRDMCQRARARLGLLPDVRDTIVYRSTTVLVL